MASSFEQENANEGQPAGQQLTGIKPKTTEPFKIEEVSPDNFSNEVIDGGSIGLWERIENAKVRGRIVTYTSLMWSIYTITTVSTAAITGNALLLTGAPLVSVPFLYVVRYYFKKGK